MVDDMTPTSNQLAHQEHAKAVLRMMAAQDAFAEICDGHSAAIRDLDAARTRLDELEAAKETFVASVTVRRNGSHWLAIDAEADAWEAFLLGGLSDDKRAAVLEVSDE